LSADISPVSQISSNKYNNIRFKGSEFKVPLKAGKLESWEAGRPRSKEY
jgi:hypothetical protein